MTLIFRVHFFLWYAGIQCINSYESVYASYYTNASTVNFGYLNLLLPFATVVLSPLVCSLADRRLTHRLYFTISLVTTTVALLLHALLPFVSKTYLEGDAERKISGLFVGPWIYYCFAALLYDLSVGVNSCLSDSFAVLQAEENKIGFGQLMVFGTLGWASSALILGGLNQWNLLPKLVPGIIFGILLLVIDLIAVSVWPRASDFKLDVIPKPVARTLTGSSSVARMDPSDYQPDNESARINVGVRLSSVGRLERVTKSPIEIFEESPLRDTTLSQTFSPPSELDSGSHATLVNTHYDGLQQSPGKEEKARSDLLESQQPLPENQVLIPSTAPAKGAQEEINAADKASFRLQVLLFGLIISRRKSLLRYLLIFTLSGFFMSMHWHYFFLYLDKIYPNKFELITAISMVGQSMLGELPFFILSKQMIDYFGRAQSISISVISIGLRFILYAYLLPNASMYTIVLADCLQGPNYGLLYVVMTDIGLEYSYCDDDTIEKLAARGEIDRNNQRQVDLVRLSLRATVQSVAYACYEGIGVGLGSLAGGWIIDNYGFKALWVSMAIASISVGSLNALFELSTKAEELREENEELGDNSDQSDFNEARRRGTLEKLATPVRLVDFRKPVSRQAGPPNRKRTS